MLYFSTGILLYLAVGGLAAPPQARSTADASASFASDNASASDKTTDGASASQQTGDPSDKPTDSATLTDSSAVSSDTGAKESASGSSAAGSVGAEASSDPSSLSASAAFVTMSGTEEGGSTTTLIPASSKSGQGYYGDSATKTSGDASPTISWPAHQSVEGEVNMTLLYGPDLRPNITHLAPIQQAANKSEHAEMFEAAGSILLALTKCNAEGHWITSMFGPPEPANGSTQEDAWKDQNLIGVHLYSFAADSKDLVKVHKTVNRTNLEKVNEFGVATDKISATEPWWPWALIEGSLQAGWVPEAEDGAYQVNVLLQLLTGVPVKEVKPDDYFYGNVTDHLQSTPVLLREKDQAIYSVLMTPAYNDTTGHPRLPLARPYLHPDEGAQFANNTLLEDLKPRVDKVLYLDGLFSLPEIQKMQKEDTDNKKSDGSESLAAGSDDAKSTGGESDGATASEAKTTEGTSTDTGATGDSTSDSGSATATSTSAGAAGESTSDSRSSTGTSTNAGATGEGTSDIGSTSATATGSGDASSEVKPSATV